MAVPADWDNHVLQERAFLDAEETRLLYVAATRARDLLVVGRWAKPGHGGPWGTFEQSLVRVPELPVPTNVAVRAVKAPKISVASRADANVQAVIRARPRPRSHVVGHVGHGRGPAHCEDGSPD